MRKLFKILGKIAGILAGLYALLFAVFYFDLDGNLLIANDRFRGMQIVDGKITLDPALPGIGVALL